MKVSWWKVALQNNVRHTGNSQHWNHFSVWQRADTGYMTHYSCGSVFYYLVLLRYSAFSAVWPRCLNQLRVQNTHYTFKNTFSNLTVTWNELLVWEVEAFDGSHTTSWGWLPVPVQLVKFTLTIPLLQFTTATFVTLVQVWGTRSGSKSC